MHRKVSLIVIVATLVTFAMIIYVAITLVNIDPQKVRTKNANQVSQKEVSEKEKSEIDKWLLEKSLNPYGDSYETTYSGGTPLFNETTGEKKDRYLYIIEKHPDKPWLK
jgi:hypothetical protein